MTNMETSRLDGSLARAKAESASRNEGPALPAETYGEASRPGPTRAQRLTLLAVALVPIGFVLMTLGAAVSPDTPPALQVPLWLLVLAGPFVLLSGSLFSGMLALMAAKPRGSIFRGGRVAGLVALTIAFL